MSVLVSSPYRCYLLPGASTRYLVALASATSSWQRVKVWAIRNRTLVQKLWSSWWPEEHFYMKCQTDSSVPHFQRGSISCFWWKQNGSFFQTWISFAQHSRQLFVKHDLVQLAFSPLNLPSCQQANETIKIKMGMEKKTQVEKCTPR